MNALSDFRRWFTSLLPRQTVINIGKLQVFGGRPERRDARRGNITPFPTAPRRHLEIRLSGPRREQPPVSNNNHNWGSVIRQIEQEKKR